MSNPNDPDVPGAAAKAGSPASRTRKFRKPAVITLAVIGGLVITPQALQAAAAAPASKQSASVQQVAAAVPTPPAGSAWLQGALTDQAGHRLDNVNVEVWSTDPAVTEPIASNLTYGGAPADGRHQHGFYRVEVPTNTPYRILFSAVGGQEDGDAWRQQWYGRGLPIMARTAARASASASASTAAVSTAALVAPAIRNLGTTQLVHQGQVGSSTRAILSRKKVKAGKRGKLRVSVTSPFVSNPTGKVIVRVTGRKITRYVGAGDRGTKSLTLPKLRRAGKHRVSVSFLGSGTVRASKAKPVKLTMRKRK